MIAAIFGFAGVILGSLTTSVLTIYRERLVTQRESAVREQQHQRERKALRDTFQRDSILALQSAVTELIRAAYAELDRLLDELRRTGEWKARQWETPTATGWSTALLSLESSRARIFDDEIRSLADDLRTIAGESVWARDVETAKEASRKLEPLLGRFNATINRALPALY
ncbi:hypothetical protein ACFO1B_08710 [Dactylosporangium siamense]|uniref:Uncharacterized protein n=1 Tax=Dactylosporangium siamense TaxID=685454 RepID=A0A919PRD1_9ACTN|nr:hypothetical protein [Dactylosporangium siamense]GIG47931.1 hypothetical protein Dsi01nite_059720 [Dactylosporangium siamense]